MRSIFDKAADNLYSRLLYFFADIFCFFFADFGGFRSIVRRFAFWLEKGQPLMLLKATYPRVLVVVEITASGDESERGAKDVFLEALKEETTKDLAERFSGLNVMILFSENKISVHIRYRRLEEYLMKISN
jgi:hypothetical protein